MNKDLIAFLQKEEKELAEKLESVRAMLRLYLVPDAEDAAKQLGQPGGEARAASLAPKRRTEIAKQAVESRWIGSNSPRVREAYEYLYLIGRRANSKEIAEHLVSRGFDLKPNAVAAFMSNSKLFDHDYSAGGYGISESPQKKKKKRKSPWTPSKTTRSYKILKASEKALLELDRPARSGEIAKHIADTQGVSYDFRFVAAVLSRVHRVYHAGEGYCIRPEYFEQIRSELNGKSILANDHAG